MNWWEELEELKKQKPKKSVTFIDDNGDKVTTNNDKFIKGNNIEIKDDE